MTIKEKDDDDLYRNDDGDPDPLPLGARVSG